MRLANHHGRAVVVTDGGVVDVADATGGAFGPSLMDVYECWDDFVTAAASIDASSASPLDVAALGSPVPMPRQVFAIGLNYAKHVAEGGAQLPTVPATFTKFPASLSGPHDDIAIMSETVDWEVELVVVIGRRADRVAEADAWSHVAGLTVGQDVSDRGLQFAAGAQFSLGKSRRGYGPMGPWLVTLDDIADRNDIPLGCSVNGVVKQQSSTSDLVFSVPRLIAELSAVVPLLPGDVIFTGTPEGVGGARKPPEFLRVGDVVETWIDGIGTIRNTCVAP
jgi:2,4-didehydro-3-deoxy-L-rhamnonate hydrolase